MAFAPAFVPAFASPLWLLGLLPWAGASLYLLWGRRKRRDVPFLELWRGPAAVERARWKVSAPPIALALALAGLLAAVLGAARPGARWRGGAVAGTTRTTDDPRKTGTAGTGTPAVTLLLDRGVTMSARGRGDLRFREAGRAAADEVARVFGPGVAVDPWILPGTTGLPAGPASGRSAVGLPSLPSRGTSTNPAAWADSLSGVLPTALDAREAVRLELRRRLAETAGPVVVVSDADLGLSVGNMPDADARRVVQVVPETAVRNVGITRLAARPTPQPQVMVRVRNDSPLTTATLRLTVAGPGAGPIDPPLARTIALPPAGAERDYFVDVKRLAAEVRAELTADDDLEADNKAWLVRESAWPAVEVARPVGPLQRLIEIYTVLHPPGDGSRRLRLVGRAEDLAAGQSGVVVPVAASAVPAAGDWVRPTQVEPHPITGAVRNWPGLDLPAVPGARPPAGWVTVLSAGERPLVAVHESASPDGPAGAARQVWVGLDAAGWADRPEYVAFWTAVLDWAGGADATGGADGVDRGAAYTSYPLEQYDPSWRPAAGNDPRDQREPGLWPGIYERLPTSPPPAPSASPIPSTTPPRRAFNVSPVQLQPRPGGNRAGDAAAWRRKLRSLRADGPGWHDLTPAPFLAAVACTLLAAATWRRREGRRDGRMTR